MVNPVVGTVPSAVAPSSRSWLGIAREGWGPAVGSAVTPTNTIPMDPKSYSPEDTPKFLPDEALRGQMAMLYNEILGPEDASFSFGGPNFLDTYGFMLDNIFGDLSTTGTASGTVVTSFSGSPSVGATQITVSSGTAFGTGSTVQIDTGTVSEVVTITAASSTSLSFGNNPLRLGHTTGTVITVIGPFTHTFALLNSGAGYGGVQGAQPPTHTLTDATNLFTGSPYTNTTGARSYASACLSSFDLLGNSEQLLDIKVAGNSWPSVIPGTAPTRNISTIVPLAAWTSKVFIGGTATNNQIYSVGEWAINVKRQLQVYFTDQGAQTPYIIARGPLGITGTIDFTVPSDQVPLNYMIQNTQPQIRIVMSNTTLGASGTATTTLQFDAQIAAFVKSKPDRNAVLIGHQSSWDAVANVTNVGGSGGLGPGTVTLINNIPTY